MKLLPLGRARPGHSSGWDAVPTATLGEPFAARAVDRRRMSPAAALNH